MQDEAGFEVIDEPSQKVDENGFEIVQPVNGKASPQVDEHGFEIVSGTPTPSVDDQKSGQIIRAVQKSRAPTMAEVQEGIASGLGETGLYGIQAEAAKAGVQSDFPQTPLVNLKPEYIQSPWINAVRSATTLLGPKAQQFEQGVEKGTAETLSSFTSPESLATLPAFTIPYVGQALALYMGGKSTYSGTKNFIDAVKEGDYEKAGKALPEVGVGLAMLHGGAKSGMELVKPKTELPPKIPTIAEVVAPETVKAAAEVGLKPGEAVPEIPVSPVSVLTQHTKAEVDSVTKGKETPNAIPEQKPNEEVLRQPQPEVGLPQVGTRNPEPEIAPGAQAPVPQGTEAAPANVEPLPTEPTGVAGTGGEETRPTPGASPSLAEIDRLDRESTEAGRRLIEAQEKEKAARDKRDSFEGSAEGHRTLVRSHHEALNELRKAMTDSTAKMKAWNEAVEQADLQGRDLVKEGAESKPEQPTAQPTPEPGVPSWVREEMQRRGLSTGRIFNDVDLGNPSIREAIQNDPTLTENQKANLLSAGSLEKPVAKPAAAESKPLSPAAAVEPAVPDVGRQAMPDSFTPEPFRISSDEISRLAEEQKLLKAKLFKKDGTPKVKQDAKDLQRFDELRKLAAEFNDHQRRQIEREKDFNREQNKKALEAIGINEGDEVSVSGYSVPVKGKVFPTRIPGEVSVEGVVVKDLSTLSKSAPEPTPQRAQPEETGQFGQGPGAKTATISSKPEAPETSEGTGLKHAIDELERTAYGFGERPQQERQNMAQAWIRAGETLARDPLSGKRLADKLIENPRRGLTGDESALLLRHKVALENALNDAAEKTITGTPEVKSEARLEYVSLSNEFKTLLDAINERGSEAGRELRWRQALAFEDYTFATQERRLMAAKGGEPLTESERATLLKEVAEHKALLEAQRKHMAEQDERHAKAIEDATKDAIDRMIQKQPKIHPDILAAAEKIVVGFENRAKAASIRLREKLSRLGAAPDPTIVFDLAEIGAGKLARKAMDFAEWSKAMVDEFGEKINPYLQDAFDASKKLLAGDLAKVKGPKAEQIKRTADAASAQAKTEDQIRKKASEGRLGDISFEVHKLAKMFVERGIKDRDALIDAVHSVLKNIIPDITRRDTMDAISGYGRFERLSKDAISVQLRDLKGQMQQVAKLEDMAAKEAPKKTGIERRSPSDEERRLIALVNEAKKKGGYEVTDPETQLVSAQMTRMTYLRNRIADLQHEIDTKQKIVKERREPPTNPEIEVLKAEYARLKEERGKLFNDALDGLKKRISKRISVLEGKASELEAKIASGEVTRADITSPPKKPGPELDATAIELQAKLKAVERRMDEAQNKARLETRTLKERMADWLVNWHRLAIISGLKTLGKLAVAGQARIAMTAADTAAGLVLNKLPLISDIAKGAPREGLTTGTPIKNILRGYVEGWKYAAKQAADVIKTSQTEAEMASGTKSIYNIPFGKYLYHLHAFMKLPAFAQEYKISLMERLQHDPPTTPVQEMALNNAAVADGIRAKLGQDNFVTKRLQMVLSSLENSREHPTTAKAIAKTMRFLLPVVHIPMNWAVEGATYTNVGAGLPRAAAKTIGPVAKGLIAGAKEGPRAALEKAMAEFESSVEALTPEQKDSIMRHWKKGAIGAGLMLLGFYERNNIGGYYQPGKKDKTKPEFGGIRFFGHDIPRYMIHIPIFEPLHFGATIGHVMDHVTKKTGERGTMSEGVLAATAGMLDEVPYVSNARNTLEILSPGPQGRYSRGEFVKSAVVPKAIEEIAKWSDGTERKPKTITEHVKAAIPGLRQTLPGPPTTP